MMDRHVSPATMLAITGTILSALGCATTARIDPNLAFAAQEGKIPKKVGLFVGAKVREFVAETNYAWITFRVPLGESLAPNAQRALKQLFADVPLTDSVSARSITERQLDHIVSIDFGSGTGIDLGVFTFSPNTVAVELIWTAHNRGASKIAEGKERVAASRRSLWGFLGGIIGNYGYMRSLQRAGDAAMQGALELVAERLSENRDKLFGTGSLQ